MELNYKLHHKDYLKQQLYQASKNKNIQKRKIRSWILLSFSGIAVTFLSYNSDNFVLFLFFCFITLSTIIFYPVYFKDRFKTHYKKHISETYKKWFGEKINIIFKESFLESKDITGELKLNYSVFSEIIEVSIHYFISIETGGTLIIPKEYLENLDEISNFFRNLALKSKIEYQNDLDWKW